MRPNGPQWNAGVDCSWLHGGEGGRMSVELYATFYVHGDLWAVNVLQVREILQRFEIAVVPQGPPAVRGLMNLRGQIVTALDLATCLGLPRPDDAGTCIVLKTDTELSRVKWANRELELTGPDPVGLVVDRMGDVMEIDTARIDATPSNIDPELRVFVRGVVQLDDELLLLLKLMPVLKC